MRGVSNIIIIMLTSLCLLVNVAEAKRFGGGKSIGMQRSATNYSRPQSTMASPMQNMKSGASKWLAPLLGLGAGALLGSLLMGHGMGSAILSWLVIGVLVFFIFGLIRRFRNPNQKPLMDFANQQQAPFQPTSSQPTSAYPFSSGATMPTDFSTDSFLREAKALFLRLQTAYDQKNLTDLRKFTSPEVFAEIQLQLQERGAETNHTEVVSLHAELLDMSQEPQMTIHGNTQLQTASVCFTGSVKEEANAPATELKETWHFQKDGHADWVVAGLQQ